MIGAFDVERWVLNNGLEMVNIYKNMLDGGPIG